ncbi:hypothetical protein M427DRAFT_147029 [Gonapodya prolifera JEL478]|uniref:MSP domain-containing protein n=1 Tax=Gonapodya prolifera (strain JEL478) TaxID=1344416 RepID=A0A139A8E1_GONPJ|nr:hypothetical protein M427DRAFT_147029 [Gonapodya prolifera JEL478]|eukprot:KXS12653.1 hypothetical protein M427DRAFT_147029 [Gonapodya prolifera JEL478]
MPAGTDYAPSTPPALSERVTASASSVPQAQAPPQPSHAVSHRPSLRPKFSAGSKVSFRTKKNASSGGRANTDMAVEVSAQPAQQRVASASSSASSGVNGAVDSNRKALRPALSRTTLAINEADEVLRRAKEFAVPQYRTRSARTAQRREFLRKSLILAEKLAREVPGKGGNPQYAHEGHNTSFKQNDNELHRGKGPPLVEMQGLNEKATFGTEDVSTSVKTQVNFEREDRNLDNTSDTDEYYRPHAVSFIPPNDYVEDSRGKGVEISARGLPPLKGWAPRSKTPPVHSPRPAVVSPTPEICLVDSPHDDPITAEELAALPDLSSYPQYEELRAPASAWHANSLTPVLQDFLIRVTTVSEDLVGHLEDVLQEMEGLEKSSEADAGMEQVVDGGDTLETMRGGDLERKNVPNEPEGHDGVLPPLPLDHGSLNSAVTTSRQFHSDFVLSSKVPPLQGPSSAPVGRKALSTNILGDHLSSTPNDRPSTPPQIARVPSLPTVTIDPHILSPLSTLTSLLSASLAAARHADRVSVARSVRRFGLAFLKTGVPVQRAQLESVSRCARVAGAVGVKLVDIDEVWEREDVQWKEWIAGSRASGGEHNARAVKRTDSKFRDEGWVFPSREGSADDGARGLRNNTKSNPSRPSPSRFDWPSFVSIPASPHDPLPTPRGLSHPPRILFSGFTPGKPLHLPLRVVNVSPIPLTIHARHRIPPTDTNPSPFRITPVGPGGPVAPGMTATFRVHFLPKHWREVEEDFDLAGWNAAGEVAKGDLTVAAKNEVARLAVEGFDGSLEMDVGAVGEADKEKSSEWVIRNDGGPVEFTMVTGDVDVDVFLLDDMFRSVVERPAECSMQVGSFQVMLCRSSLGRGEKCTLWTKYMPDRLDTDTAFRDDVGMFKLVCCDGMTIEFGVRGRIERGRVEIAGVGGNGSTVELTRPWNHHGPGSPECDLLPIQRATDLVAAVLDFPAQIAKTEACVAVQIFNPTKLVLRFTWQLVMETTVAKSTGEFSVYPNEGLMEPCAQRMFIFKFCPKMVGRMTALWELCLGGEADGTGMRIRIVGLCVHPITELFPARMEITNPLNGSVARVSYLWSMFNVDCALLLHPVSGSLTLDAGQEGSINVLVEGGLEGKRRDCYAFNTAKLDFGMIALGDQKTLSITLLCDSPKDLCGLVSKEFEILAVEDFYSDHASDVICVSPRGTTISSSCSAVIQVEMKAFSRGSYQGFLLARVRDNQSKWQVACVAEVVAQVETPRISLPNEYDLGEIFTNVEKKGIVSLENVSRLEASFALEIMHATPSDRIECSHLRGVVQPGEKMDVEVRWICTSRVFGTREVLLICDVPGMVDSDGPLQMKMKAEVCGLSLVWELDGWVEPLLDNEKADRSLLPVCFNHVPVLETQTKVLQITNRTPIKARYRVAFEHHGAPTGPAEKCDQAPLSPPRHIGILKPSKISEPLGFSSRVGNSFVSRVVETRRKEALMREMLQLGKGVAFTSTPTVGVVDPNSSARIVLTMYNNMPGRYSDRVVVDLETWFSRTFEIESVIEGAPLELSSDHFLTASKQYTLNFGTFKNQASRSSDTTREFTVKNCSPHSIKIKWSFHDVCGRDLNCDALPSSSRGSTDQSRPLYSMKDSWNTILAGQSLVVRIEVSPDREGEHKMELVGVCEFLSAEAQIPEAQQEDREFRIFLLSKVV